MNFVSIFSLLGLGSEFAKIYSILLEKGQMRMIEIGKITNLPRTSCYEYVPKLIELGLVSETTEGKSKFYKAQSPANLLSLLYKLKNDLNFGLQMIENDFQALIDMYTKNSAEKSIMEIENIESFEENFEDIKSAEELYIILPTSYENHLNKKMTSNLETLIKKHKHIKIENLESIKLISNDKILSLSIKTGVGILYMDRNIVNSEKIIFEKLYANA